MKPLRLFIFVIVIVVTGCSSIGGHLPGKPTVIDPGNDPNFTIVPNSDVNLKRFDRKVEVFGIPVYAVAAVDDSRLLHAANVLAQYLDNDEDGVVDNRKVVDAMTGEKAFLVMWKRERDLRDIDPDAFPSAQDLGNDETNPDFVSGGRTGRFDAAIEEIWHLVTHTGYAVAYPDVFGENPGTSLTDAMDVARGGRFMSVPDSYPLDAWYSYDDETCDYACMAAEYFYWAMSSLLGAQENRTEEILDEWRLNTASLLYGTDTAVYRLLKDPRYKLPTVLPDGKYRR